MDKLGCWKSLFGFCNGKSCLTKLKLFAVENKNMDKGGPLNKIYLDFQNAFEKVSKN